MKYLKIAGFILLAVGSLMIMFAKQLGILYEGGQVTMSDLGFIASGMMVAVVGAALLILWIMVRLLRR